MTRDGQDARSTDPADPAAFTADETERLIRFFQILDAWDRESASRRVLRADGAAVPCGVPAGTERPTQVPIVQE